MSPGPGLRMSDRRVWLLVDAVNRAFEEPAVVTHPGRRDGGAELTPFGARLVALYRTVERRAAEASAGALAELAAARVPVVGDEAETDVSRAG